MTVQTSFFDWANSGLDWDAPPYEQASPNLLALQSFLIQNYGGQGLGLHGDRPIREGAKISEHAYGAALDWRYSALTNGGREVGRTVALNTLLPWLIGQSKELGICSIHDYAGDRIWRPPGTSGRPASGDGWKKQYGAGGGMGESWATYFHIVTTKAAWANSLPITQRGIPLPGTIPPVVVPPPEGTVGRELVEGMSGPEVRTLQQALVVRGYRIAVDGQFGPGTLQAVRTFQASVGLNPDGRAGQRTLTALGIWSGTAPPPPPPTHPDPATLTTPEGTPTMGPGSATKPRSTDANTVIEGVANDGRVTWYQVVLRVTPTGVYDDETVAATKQFQANMRIGVDGWYGEHTEQALRTYRGK